LGHPQAPSGKRLQVFEHGDRRPSIGRVPSEVTDTGFFGAASQSG